MHCVMTRFGPHRWTPLLLLALLCGCAAPMAPTPGGAESGGWFGKADSASSEGRRALLVVPNYSHSRKQRADTSWVLENAERIRADLEYHRWSVDITSPPSLDDFAADLDAMIERGERVDAVVFLGHANQRGFFFDNPTGQNDREWLQPGWDWEGPGRMLDVSAGSGVASLDGLMEYTDRLAEVVRADGIIVLAGCRTARSRRASLSDVARNLPKAVPPTPFVKPEDGTPYDNYAQAVAELTGRTTFGSRIRDNIGRAPQKVWTIFFGGRDGTGGVPRWWVRAVPEGGAAKADGTDVAGGVTAGAGCETYEQCLAADDDGWDSEEGS